MGQSGNARRPVFAIFAGPTQEMRPFLANLKLDGKLRIHTARRKGYQSKAELRGESMEFMKTAAYNVDVQVHGSAMVATVYQPTLFYLEPIGGISADDQDAEFSYVCMPGAARLAAEQNRLDNATIYSHLHAAKFPQAADIAGFNAQAALFAAGVGRRIDIPIIHDMRFYAQLCAAFLNSGLATYATPEPQRGTTFQKSWGHNPRHGYHETGVELAGYAPGICVHTSQKLARALISSETARFELILTGSDAGPPVIPSIKETDYEVDVDSEEDDLDEGAEDADAPEPEDLTTTYGEDD